MTDFPEPDALGRVWLPLPQAAAVLGVSPSTLRRRVDAPDNSRGYEKAMRRQGEYRVVAVTAAEVAAFRERDLPETPPVLAPPEVSPPAPDEDASALSRLLESFPPPPTPSPESYLPPPGSFQGGAFQPEQLAALFVAPLERASERAEALAREAGSLAVRLAAAEEHIRRQDATASEAQARTDCLARKLAERSAALLLAEKAYDELAAEVRARTLAETSPDEPTGDPEPAAVSEEAPPRPGLWQRLTDWLMTPVT